MTNAANENNLLELANTLEQGNPERSPEINALAAQLNKMKEVFKGLPSENLSDSAKERLFAVLSQAFELHFNEMLSEKQKQFKHLYDLLQGFSPANLEKIINFWRQWVTQEKIEMKERDFVNTLQLAARVANECTEAEFLGALIHEEMPPISLSDEELECLSGGTKLSSFSDALSPKFLSDAFARNF